MTASVLFLQGMQNPVRSRPCQAARYFLKEVDFDIGECLLFVFHGKPFQKVRENVSNYSGQIEGFSFLRTCSQLIQVRTRKVFCCLCSVTYKINWRLHADFCQRAFSPEQGSTFGAVSVKTRMPGQCRDCMPPETGQLWSSGALVGQSSPTPSVLLQKVALSSVVLQTRGQQNF